MKRDFVVTCNYEDEYYVKSIVANFHKRRFTRVNDTRDNGHTDVHFRCTRSKLPECRLLLGRMLNEGLLLNVEETW